MYFCKISFFFKDFLDFFVLKFLIFIFKAALLNHCLIIILIKIKEAKLEKLKV